MCTEMKGKSDRLDWRSGVEWNGVAATTVTDFVELRNMQHLISSHLHPSRESGTHRVGIVPCPCINYRTNRLFGLLGCCPIGSGSDMSNGSPSLHIRIRYTYITLSPFLHFMSCFPSDFSPASADQTSSATLRYTLVIEACKRVASEWLVPIFLPYPPTTSTHPLFILSHWTYPGWTVLHVHPQHRTYHGAAATKSFMPAGLDTCLVPTDSTSTWKVGRVWRRRQRKKTPPG